jgi:hypothetical protein
MGISITILTLNSQVSTITATATTGKTLKSTQQQRSFSKERNVFSPNFRPQQPAPLSAEARRVIEDADVRVAHADHQRDEAEARKRVL